MSRSMLPRRLAGPRHFGLACALAMLTALLPSFAEGAAATPRLDWGTRAPMLNKRSVFGATASPNGKLYVAGGIISSAGLATVEEYDPRAPPPCTPRPNVGLSTSKLTSGQLQAIVNSQTNASTPANRLVSVQIVSIANAAVKLNGSSVAAGQSVTLPANTTQATLLLDRHAPAQNPALASTVAIVVTDSCGAWQTFVGGGPAAF